MSRPASSPRLPAKPTPAPSPRWPRCGHGRTHGDAWRANPDLVAAKLVADAWCAAFVQPKTGATTSGQGITHATVRALSETPESVPDTIVTQVNTLARQYRFFHWHLEFPGIFTVPDDGSADAVTGWTGGFSCVVGNPPWERVKIQDKEFFGNAGRPDIEGAATAAIRKKMIDKLADTDPDLHHAYLAALRQSDGTAHLLLKSDRYPFTGQGDVNTYSVFAETMRTVTRPAEASAGIITPTGLATDNTTAPFFADTLEQPPTIRLLRFRERSEDLLRRHEPCTVCNHYYHGYCASGRQNTIRVCCSPHLRCS